MMQNFEIDGVIPVQATVVDEPIKQIQIPPGMRPGESFIVTPDNCPPFTVIVPEGAAPGSYITVVIPHEVHITSSDGSPMSTNHSNSRHIKIDKGVAGAAVVGGVIGVLALGAVGGVLLAGGAAYAASRTDHRIGQKVNSLGTKSYKGIAAVKNWTMKQLQK